MLVVNDGDDAVECFTLFRIPRNVPHFYMNCGCGRLSFRTAAIYSFMK